MTRKRNSAPKAIADVSQGTILATVEIAAAPERVFRALTTDEVVKWWGADGVYWTTSFTADLKVGGSYRAEGKGADGKPFVVSGEYLEIAAPHKLVQTWKPDWDGGHATTLTYLLEAIDDGTRVTVRHEGFSGRTESCRAHGEGWGLVLGWLAGYAAPPATDRFFIFRLFGPRPTFPADATPEELSIMREHVAYWAGHLRTGAAIVFGPVADPKGTWGLSVVRVPDEDVLRALQEGDPVIRSGRGFRYEVLPMVRAIVRD